MSATKVLVVEDERIVALNLQQRLVKLGYDVPVICASGAQALNNVEHGQPDIVLMDINIEGDFDGIETAARIGETADTPVVFLTAYSEEATLMRARATKPYGYLLKPFSERELHATIQMALERHKSQRQAHEELRAQIQDNALLQTQIQESTEHLAVRELTKRLVDELALAAEASSLVPELLASALDLLARCGGWHWAAASSFKGTRQHSAQIVATFADDELILAADNDSALSAIFKDLQSRSEADWLDEVALRRVVQSGFYRGPIHFGYWMPIVISGRLRAGFLFLHPTKMLDRQCWNFLFEQTNSELIRFIERKDYQEKLRQLSSAVEHSPASVMITDASGDIEYVNPQFTDATGYVQDEVLGENPRLLKSGKMADDVYTGLWKNLVEGEIWRGEFHNRKKSGEEFWESSAIAPVSDAHGKITHYVAVKEDITERKRLNEELLAAKEVAEAANMAKSAFLANMSHEIRTPLNAILGLNFLLQKTPLSTIQMEYAEKTESAAEFLLAILNDILDLSKIEAGKLELESVDFRLDALLQNVAMILQAKADEKHLHLRTDFSADIPLDLRGDSLRIKQILVNLGGNAIKFTDSGSVTITVRAEAINPGDVQLRFSVQDTGIGLSAEQRGILFEVFRQGDASTTRRYGGSGLGLAICKRLAGMMGGDIDVVSTPGQGSNFSFVIPLERAKTAVPAVARAADTNGELLKFAGARVLLVEDSELNQQVARAILNYLGVNAEVAANGQEALDLVRANGSNYYRLVLMDIQMPVMDGFAATREIRHLKDAAELPIVAMTADVMSEDRDRCFAAGMNGHITKPINIRQLTEVLIRWLS
ncbi:MAG: multi-sensor hybrid histidine kinase [Verrucomicrobiaceae bacterium]|nr:multi-sensor hybrid histidine kinase [Verrucomicrobiaceae bacterium]